MNPARHARPHQIRRSRSSELKSTVVAVSVSIVVMTSSLVTSMKEAYNNFHTKEANESRNSE
jgi:hypothetical protein